MSQPATDICSCLYTFAFDANQKPNVTMFTNLRHTSLDPQSVDIIHSNFITQAQSLRANIHSHSNLYSATSLQYQFYTDVTGTRASNAMHIAPVESYVWNTSCEVSNSVLGTVLQNAMQHWTRLLDYNFTDLVRKEKHFILNSAQTERFSTKSKVFTSTNGLASIAHIHSDFFFRNKSRPVVTGLTSTLPLESPQVSSIYLAPRSLKKPRMTQIECSQLKRNRWYLSSHQITKCSTQDLCTKHSRRDLLLYRHLLRMPYMQCRLTNWCKLLHINMFDVYHPSEQFFSNTDHCISNLESRMKHFETIQPATERRADYNTSGLSALQAVESEEGMFNLTTYLASDTGSRSVEKGESFLILPQIGVEQSKKASALSPECFRIDETSTFSFKDPCGGHLKKIPHSLTYAHSESQTLPLEVNIHQIYYWSTVILHLALTIGYEYGVLGYCGISPSNVTKHTEVGNEANSEFRERRSNNILQTAFHLAYFEIIVNNLPSSPISLLCELENQFHLYTVRKNSITIKEAVSLQMSKTKHIYAQGEVKTCWISTTRLVTRQHYGCTVEIDLEDAYKLSSECLELDSCYTHFVESPNHRGANERKATVPQNANTERILFKTERGSYTPNALDYSKKKGHDCEAKQRLGDSSQPSRKSSEFDSQDSVYTASNTRRVLHTERGDPGHQAESGPLELCKTQYSLSTLARSSRSHHTRLEFSEDTSVSSEDQLNEKDELHKGITVSSLLRRYDRLTKELLETKRSIQLLCQRENKGHKNRLDSSAEDTGVTSTKEKSTKQRNGSEAAVVYNYFEKLRRQSRMEAYPRNTQQCTAAIRQELNSPTLKNARQVPFYSTHDIPPPASNSAVQHPRQCSSSELHPVSQGLKDYYAPIHPAYATKLPEHSKAGFPVNTYWTPSLNHPPTSETLYPIPYALLTWPTLVNGQKPKQLTPTQPDSYSRSVLNRRTRKCPQAESAHRKHRSHSRRRSRSQSTTTLEQRPRVSPVISPTYIPLPYYCTHSGLPGATCCPSSAVMLQKPKSVPHCSVIHDCCNAGFCFPCATSSAAYHHHSAKQRTQGPPERQGEKRTDVAACLAHQTQTFFVHPDTTLTDKEVPASSKPTVCPISIQGSVDNTVPKARRQMPQTNWVSGRHCLLPRSAYEPTVPSHICMSHEMINHRCSPPHSVPQIKEVVHSNLAPMYESEQHRHIEPPGQPWPRSPAMKTETSFSAQPTSRVLPPKQYPQVPSCQEIDRRPDARWNNQPTDMQQPTAKTTERQSGLYEQICTKNSKPPGNGTYQVGQMGVTKIPSIIANPMPRTANQSLKDVQLVDAEKSAPPPALPERSMVAARAHLRADPVTPEDWKEVERRYDQLQRDRAALEAHFFRSSRNGPVGKVGVHSDDAQLNSSLVQLDEQLSALRLLLQRRHAENRRLATGSK